MTIRIHHSQNLSNCGKMVRIGQQETLGLKNQKTLECIFPLAQQRGIIWRMEDIQIEKPNSTISSLRFLKTEEQTG